MRPEDRLQSRCRMYLAAALPAPGFWSSVDHARKQSVRSGQVQKARGVKRGLPDIMVWYEGRFIGIELKVGTGVTEMQMLFGEAMRRNGFRYYVVVSVLGLHTALREAGVPVLPSMQIAALNHDAALRGPEPARAPGKPRGKGMAAKPDAARLRAVQRARGQGTFAA